MSRKFLGEEIDIHAGGADLMFPHHENEIAQSECANGCRFVKYFLHNGFVTINKEKMSKSLGNFLTIDDLLEKYDSNAIRFFILTNHYRMPVEFTELALDSAKAGVKRLINTGIQGELRDEEAILEFKSAMDDDLNTSKALAVLFSLVDKFKKTNDVKYSNTIHLLGSVLGFNFGLKEKKELSEEELKEKIAPIYSAFEYDENLGAKALLEDLISKRNEARKNKDWAMSDKIRDELKAVGVILKDSKEATTWEVE